MTAKKASKAPVEEVAPAAVPPVEETLTLEQHAAGAAAVAKQEHGYFGEPASTVMVLVGPNGAAGRIVLGRVAYDAVTPRAMSRADFERLRGAYDLREV